MSCCSLILGGMFMFALYSPFQARRGGNTLRFVRYVAYFVMSLNSDQNAYRLRKSR